jgi:hypothetical protein
MEQQKEPQEVSRIPGRIPMEVRVSREAQRTLTQLARRHRIFDHMGRPNRSEVVRRLMARGLAALKEGEAP